MPKQDDISMENLNILKTTYSETEQKVKHYCFLWTKEFNVPPDLIRSQQCLLQGTHAQRSKIKMLRFSFAKEREGSVWSMGPLMRNARG